MNGEDLEHVAVVFLEVALHPQRVPIFGGRTYGVVSGGIRIEGWWRIHVSCGVAPLEFGHLDHSAAIGLRQLEDASLFNEAFDIRNVLFDFGGELFGRAMFMADCGQDL